MKKKQEVLKEKDKEEQQEVPKRKTEVPKEVDITIWLESIHMHLSNHRHASNKLFKKLKYL